MTKLLLFGANPYTERVRHEVMQSAVFEAVGIVDDAKAAEAHASGMPIYTMAEAVETFSTKGVAMFAVSGNAYLNQERLAAYMACKQAGFAMASVASASADIASDVKLRENVFIDAHARILPRGNIGANTWIMRNTEIGVGAKLGSSCWISAGCSIGDGATLGKNCTLTEGVIIKPGVVLPAWSTINQPMIIDATVARALFVDPLFRGPVTLHGAG